MPIEVEEADVVEAEELEAFVEVALRGHQGLHVLVEVGTVSS